jgi:hypothetical protein
MTYWYVDDITVDRTGGLHYSDHVPETAVSWGRNDERGVYHYRTEATAQELVDKWGGGLHRIGTTVFEKGKGK